MSECAVNWDLDSIYGLNNGSVGYRGVPVLVHVGFHKTGTTWLQKNILQPKAGSEFIYCFDFETTHSAIILPGLGLFDPQTSLGHFKDAIERAERENLPIIITDEALGGFPFHKKYNREMNAIRIKKLFPDAKILLTVREQSSVILSMYGEYIKYGYSSALSDFVYQPHHPLFTSILDRNFYDYDRALTLYEAIFGAGNVLAFPLEWMSRNSAAAVERMANFMGVELSAPDASLASERQNQAWTPAATSVARFCNRFIPQDSRWSRKRSWLAKKLGPNALATRVNRWSDALGVKSSSGKDKAQVRAALGDYYAEPNRRFAERTGYDLAGLGYVVTPK